MVVIWATWIAFLYLENSSLKKSWWQAQVFPLMEWKMSDTFSASLAARVQACDLGFSFIHLCGTFDSQLDTSNSLPLPSCAFLSPCLLEAVDVTASRSGQRVKCIVYSLLSTATDVRWQPCDNLPSTFPESSKSLEATPSQEKPGWLVTPANFLIRSVLWVVYPCCLGSSLVFQLSQDVCEPYNIP